VCEQEGTSELRSRLRDCVPRHVRIRAVDVEERRLVRRRSLGARRAKALERLVGRRMGRRRVRGGGKGCHAMAD